MNDLTLVIMAAGMGSRFGGLKQITPIDDNGNFIIDYSVYDAIRAGFKKIVFIIKEENYEDFKETIGKRINSKIDVSYVFQKIEDIPVNDKDIVEKRVKPWGTSHAILSARNEVLGNLAVINADDFYSFDAYKQVVDFFKNTNEAYTYVSVPYKFIKTSSQKGAVKRGVLDIIDGKVKGIKECSLEVKGDEVIASPLDGSELFKIDKEALVSMNMFGFKNDFFELLDEQVKNYFEHDKEYILTNEILLPDCLEDNINKNKITVFAKSTDALWLGMTYKEDLDEVKKSVHELVKKGEYPSKLWG